MNKGNWGLFYDELGFVKIKFFKVVKKELKNGEYRVYCIGLYGEKRIYCWVIKYFC